MRHLNVLRVVAVGVCFVVLVVTMYWNNASYRNFNEDLRRKLLSFSDTPAPTTTFSPVTERTNIFFLKAHKCASSTVQNILMRFGFSRDLDFVLPLNNNYLGSPEPFKVKLINEKLISLNGKYNIFAHHTRYNNIETKKTMYDDAAFVTILRHPADVFESLFSYYKLNRTYKISLEELLKSPNRIRLILRRFAMKIGVNQMSFDLGLPEQMFKLEDKIRLFIDKIDREFDLVMISEYMEASLVLLCDLMRWPLENVVFLKLNSRPDAAKYPLTNKDRKLLTDLNFADSLLYQHFLDKFQSKIKQYGEERMRENIIRLMDLNERLNFRCVDGINMKGFGHTTAYNLRTTSDWLCFYAARGELAFTNELRTHQINKFKVLRKLDAFMNSDVGNSNYLMNVTYS